MQIPENLLPADGRFGSGPAKVRAAATDHLIANAHLLGTSHRQSPVKDLVGRVQSMLRELYALPDGYEVVLGNGGASLLWDVATCCLVERRAAHGVFGEFGGKFAAATTAAPFLEPSDVVEAPPGQVALPRADADADVFAWAHNETSTGALAPVRRIGDGLVLVDGTSAAGGVEVDVAETDLYYCSPQKNFSSDGGLWIAMASPAAVERARAVEATRWVPPMLSFTAAADNSRKQQTVNTPAIATLLLLEAQLAWMLELGGLTAAADRCRANSGAVYAWAEARDWASPFVEDPAHRSPVVATVDLDERIDHKAVIAELRASGILDVEPYRSLGRNQLRIGCFASVDVADVEALLACIDHVVEHV